MSGSSLDIQFLTLRNITAYKSDNSFADNGGLLIVGQNGQASFTDSVSTLNISTLSAQNISTTSLILDNIVARSSISTTLSIFNSISDIEYDIPNNTLGVKGNELYFGGIPITGSYEDAYWKSTINGTIIPLNESITVSTGKNLIVASSLIVKKSGAIITGDSIINGNLNVTSTLYTSTLAINTLNITNGVINNVANINMINGQMTGINSITSQNGILIINSTINTSSMNASTLIISTINGAPYDSGNDIYWKSINGVVSSNTNLPINIGTELQTNIIQLNDGIISGLNNELKLHSNSGSYIFTNILDNYNYATLYVSASGSLEFSSAPDNQGGIIFQPNGSIGEPMMTLDISGNLLLQPDTAYISTNIIEMTSGQLNGVSTINSISNLELKGAEIIIGEGSISFPGTDAGPATTLIIDNSGNTIFESDGIMTLKTSHNTIIGGGSVQFPCPTGDKPTSFYVDTSGDTLIYSSGNISINSDGNMLNVVPVGKDLQIQKGNGSIGTIYDTVYNPVPFPIITPLISASPTVITYDQTITVTQNGVYQLQLYIYDTQLGASNYVQMYCVDNGNNIIPYSPYTYLSPNDGNIDITLTSGTFISPDSTIKIIVDTSTPITANQWYLQLIELR